MDHFVIQRTDQGGGFVARPGSASAYTRDLRKARTFPTREAAEADRCPDNERTVHVHDLLGDAP